MDAVQLIAEFQRSRGQGHGRTAKMTTTAIIAECIRLIERGTKPTLPEVRPLIDAYYLLPDNGAGGELHVVLDDGNYESRHIDSSIREAIQLETRYLGRVLLMLSNSQRRRM